MSSEFAINLNSGRLIKKTTSLYKKLKKMNRTKEIEDEEEPKVEKVKEPSHRPLVEASHRHVEEPIEEPFNEHKLQEKLADISTDLIKSNLKKVVKAQKLSDAEFDILLKKMLFKKLCINEQPKQPKEDKKKKKKSKFKIVEPSSSDSESSD
jgi:hypothetical protein